MSDAWGIEESSLNKAGTFVTVLVPLLSALLVAGYLPFTVPGAYLLIAVVVAGLLGGVLNVAGRGPLWAGALVGLIMAVGGFGAVYLWIDGKESVMKLEIGIAFVVGAAPGFILQHFLPRWLGCAPAPDADQAVE